MKPNQIALAVAAACAAAPAFALTPAQIDSTTVQLWISGATAPTASVYKGIRTLCADNDGNGSPDDLHVYTEKADPNPGKSAAGKFFAYACTMGPLAASLDGVKTVVYHTADAGSFEAYTPHLFQAGEVHPLVGSTLKRMKPVKGANSCATSTVVNATGDATYVGCGADTVTLAPNASPYGVPTLPQGGFSDTEYTLNQLNLGISKSLSDIGSETPTNVGQGFGLAVSHPLYAALQKAQGLINTTAADGEACDGKYAAGACQPGINRQKYASLVSAGSVTNKDGSLFGAPAGSVIKVERRVGTSGTQSASNAFFLNTPCATGAPGGSKSPAGSNNAGTASYNGGKVLVRSNNGSGDVKASLTAASTAGELAIGVLSLENVPSASEKFAFVKLNGVAPNADAKQRQTAINGDYEMWYELVAFTAGSAFGEGADLINGTVIALGDPSITDLTGLFVTKAAGVTGANVSKGYKLGNACAPAVQ
ncbi:MAG: hypothetical protein ACYC5S_01715 [Thiobacillus sp.]